MLHHLGDMGITIMVSTPYMDEAAQCDRVALMDEGQILSLNTPTAVTEQFDGPLYAVYADHQYALLQQVRQYVHTESAHPFGSSIHVTLTDTHPERLRAYLQEQGITARVDQITPGIEDQFMALMGREDADVRHD
jgi:ABC-type multidrug transport system ATPase subunit